MTVIQGVPFWTSLLDLSIGINRGKKKIMKFYLLILHFEPFKNLENSLNIGEKTTIKVFKQSYNMKCL